MYWGTLRYLRSVFNVGTSNPSYTLWCTLYRSKTTSCDVPLITNQPLCMEFSYHESSVRTINLTQSLKQPSNQPSLSQITIPRCIAFFLVAQYTPSSDSSSKASATRHCVYVVFDNVCSPAFCSEHPDTMPRRHLIEAS
jgi:hypothetical protein